MRTIDIIQKKRDGKPLDDGEIRYLIRGFVNGSIPDYQMAAWAMAVYFQGMTAKETASLTMEMAHSGDLMNLSAIRGVKVDKHSTGGVGDTTTLVLAPLVACAGVPVAKMSGRGLGHTGGTIDKLEAIPGFQAELSEERFVRQVNELKIALTGQTGNITPADKKLYALRDVTATVDSISLIASSIMSKKIASGADAIVLDVKTGRGAFMKSLDDSIALAQAMVNIGTEVGRETVAIISNMNQPLGRAVGNALEVREAIETLRGEGPADLRDLCLELGAHMLVLGGKAQHPEEAKETLKKRIHDGSALRAFRTFIQAQGGDETVADSAAPDVLPTAERMMEVPADTDGYIADVEAETIGIGATMLGAGRETKEASIDPAAGIVMQYKQGDAVRKGEPLATLHYGRAYAQRADQVAELVRNAYRIVPTPTQPEPLIFARVTKHGVEKR